MSAQLVRNEFTIFTPRMMNNLAFIHLFAREFATGADARCPELFHRLFETADSAGSRNIFSKPFPERLVQRYVPRSRDKPGLVNEGIIGTKCHVAHTNPVYGKLVYIPNIDQP